MRQFPLAECPVDKDNAVAVGCVGCSRTEGLSEEICNKLLGLRIGVYCPCIPPVSVGSKESPFPHIKVSLCVYV